MLLRKTFPGNLISHHIVLAAEDLAKWVPLFFATYFSCHGPLEL